jgi:hypothetical protein
MRDCAKTDGWTDGKPQSGALLPAREGEERADAWVPPKRTIRRECRNMETARREREDNQRVNKR